MSDNHDHGDGDGDQPDTFDDRLADLARLIDTLVDERDEQRRLDHRRVVLRLLARLAADALARVAAQLDRLDA